MGIQGPFKVNCSEVFPQGLGVVGAVSPLADFDASTREKRVQARERDSGLPVWSVEVMDLDPEARERTFKVKIPAALCSRCRRRRFGGAPVRPVMLEGLTVTPYLKDVGNGRQRIGHSWRASGLVAPRRVEAG
jgi:hypothetical protein